MSHGIPNVAVHSTARLADEAREKRKAMQEQEAREQREAERCHCGETKRVHDRKYRVHGRAQWSCRRCGRLIA